MSILDRLRPDQRPGTPRGGPSADYGADGGPVPVGPVMALLTGSWTAAVGWLAVALPGLLAWATSAQTSATWVDAVRVTTDLWLVLHRVTVLVPSGAVNLAPLAGMLLPAWLCWTAGRRIGAGLTARESAATGSVLRALAPAVGCFAAGYCLVLLLAAATARGAGVQPVLWQAVVAGLALPASAAGVAALRASGRSAADTLAAAVRLPARVRRTARAGGIGAAALLAAASVLLTATLVGQFDRILALHRALDPGVVGGAVLALGQLALLPNLTLWALGFVAGPGFAIGAGTVVTPGGSQLGLLPLVPVLGAAPAPGALPTAVVGVVVLPVLVGALVGYLAVHGRHRSDDAPAGVLDAVAEALTAVLTATLLLTALLALSGGAAGPGSLAAVGPSPWRAGLALAGELAAGAAAAAWVTHRRRRG